MNERMAALEKVSELRLHPVRDEATKERLAVVWSLIDRGWWRGRSLLPLYDVSSLLKYRFLELSKHARLDREAKNRIAKEERAAEEDRLDRMRASRPNVQLDPRGE
jgi:hypothetical protein